MFLLFRSLGSVQYIMEQIILEGVEFGYFKHFLPRLAPLPCRTREVRTQAREEKDTQGFPSAGVWHPRRWWRGQKI